MVKPAQFPPPSTPLASGSLPSAGATPNPPEKSVSSADGFDGTVGAKTKPLPVYPPPVPPGVQDNRSDPLFTQQFPGNTTFKTSRGVDVPWPFKIYNAVQTMITGTADYAEASKLVPPGYEAVKLNGHAIVHFCLNNDLDSSVGPYHELVAWIDVVPQGAPAGQKSVDQVNAFSSLVPLATGATGCMFKLVLDNRDAIDVGVEKAGYPKVPGKLKLPLNFTDAFSVSETSGKVVSGHFTQPLDPAVDGPAMLAGLAAALHVPSLPPPTSPYSPWPTVNFDAAKHDGSIRTGQAVLKSSDIQVPYDPKKHHITIEDDSDLGRLLKNKLHFHPTLVGFGANWMGVFQ